MSELQEPAGLYLPSAGITSHVPPFCNVWLMLITTTMPTKAFLAGSTQAQLEKAFGICPKTGSPGRNFHSSPFMSLPSHCWAALSSRDILQALSSLEGAIYPVPSPCCVPPYAYSTLCVYPVLRFIQELFVCHQSFIMAGTDSPA